MAIPDDEPVLDREAPDKRLDARRRGNLDRLAETLEPTQADRPCDLIGALRHQPADDSRPHRMTDEIDAPSIHGMLPAQHAQHSVEQRRPIGPGEHVRERGNDDDVVLLGQLLDEARAVGLHEHVLVAETVKGDEERDWLDRRRPPQAPSRTRTPGALRGQRAKRTHSTHSVPPQVPCGAQKRCELVEPADGWGVVPRKKHQGNDIELPVQPKHGDS